MQREVVITLCIDYCDIYCRDHIISFRALLEAALGMGPRIVNCHSGHDSWTVEEGVLYFTEALRIEKEFLSTGNHTNVLVVHETHRQRLLYSPYQARDILSRPELQEIKINADLSHWVCVCEHVFNESDLRDSWWPNVLSLVASHCCFVHGRVGHEEGPQVLDPRQWGDVVEEGGVPADKKTYPPGTEAHLKWWEAIWKSQRARGMTECYVEAEHGPEPYQMYEACPRRGGVDISKAPISEEEKEEILWEINKYVADMISRRFERIMR
jgi:hypothetical protein